MISAEKLAEVTRDARVETPPDFDASMLERLLPQWEELLRGSASLGAAECVIKTPFGLGDCLAQTTIKNLLSSLGFEGVPMAFLAGEHNRLQISISWGRSV